VDAELVSREDVLEMECNEQIDREEAVARPSATSGDGHSNFIQP
jgi:hypothetical protein